MMDAGRLDAFGADVAARRLSRRTALKAGGVGLAASVLPGGGRRAAAQPGTPTATPRIDRAAVDAALPQLTELAETAVRDGGVPGLSLAVVYGDEVALTAGFGVRSTEGNEPVGPDTVFQLASLSKPVASTVVSAIVGTGAATWDDRVLDHLPDFRLSDPWATRETTIADLFAHRSGLGGDAGNDLELVGYDRAAIFERLRYLALASSPRSTYAYSNAGLTVGGVAAAAAVGMSWDGAAEALLYRPLKMASTSSRHADFAARANRALLHVRIGGAWVPAFDRNADPQSPAGGASSTATDLAQWLRLLLGDGTVDGRELVPAGPLLAARAPVMSRGAAPITGFPSFYGLGWGIEYQEDGALSLSHAGAFTLGARTMVSLLPAEQLGIVVLANAFPTGVPDGLAAAFFDLARNGSLSRDWIAAWSAPYDALYAAFAASGAAYETAPASPSPALPTSAYVGAYANDYVGPVEIGEAGGGLELAIGPERRSYALRHFDRDTFVCRIDLEPPAPLTGATFVIGPDGRAAALRLDYFAGNGQEHFPRAAER
jgi:CubicO group peptidase (beta-lactamase class C family)